MLPMEARENAEQTTQWEEMATKNDNYIMELEEEYQREHSVMFVFIAAYVLFIVLILIGNGLVIGLVAFKRKLRSPTNYYIAALCVSDIMVGVFAVPMDIMEHYNEDYMTTGSCRTVEYFVHVSLAANILCLVLIAFDRDRSIMRPFKPKQTKRVCATCISAVWFISFAYGARVTVLYDMTEVAHLQDGEWTLYNYCAIPDSNFDMYKIIIVFDFFVLYLIPLFLISIMYGRITWRIWRERRGNIVGSVHTSRRKRKVIRMLLIIVVIFIVCQLPHHVYKLYKYWVGIFPGFLIIHHVCDLISFSNSWLNVIAYVFCNDNFKSELKKLGRKYHCPCFRKRGRRVQDQNQGHGIEEDKSVWTVDMLEHTQHRTLGGAYSTSEFTSTINTGPGVFMMRRSRRD